MKHYNAKPSSVSNIGEDVLGAARHRNDTYENPEVAKAKAFQKKSKANLKELLAEYKVKFTTALHESSEAGRAVLMEYEYKKTMLSCDLLKDFNGTMEEFRELVRGTQDRNSREILRKKFNSLNSKRHKIRFRIRPIELPKYFDTKTREAFTEYNGIKTDWTTKSESFDSKLLEAKVRAVQFGNSVPDSERVYVSENLIKSIQILEKYFSFDLKTLGFSFGARGRAGSIAHYQDSAKVLAFNRHWDGALIHELGHAIDYSLGLASRQIPYELEKKYRDKLRANEIPYEKRRYYEDPREIFARLFEMYCKNIIPELTQFMFFEFNPSVMPDLDAESLQWIGGVLSKLLKGV